jgi:hypothetical protein
VEPVGGEQRRVDRERPTGPLVGVGQVTAVDPDDLRLSLPQLGAGRLHDLAQEDRHVGHGGHLADPDERAGRAFAVDPSLFSADRFHPSSAGYAVIAASVLPAVLAAARAATAAS